MTFVDAGGTTETTLRGAIAVNDAEAYLTCGLRGVGLLQLPRFMAVPHLRSGALVEVLPRWKPRPMPISAVYPHNRHLAPKVRVFVDWAAQLFETCPLMCAENWDEDRCLPVAKPRALVDRKKQPEDVDAHEVIV